MPLLHWVESERKAWFGIPKRESEKNEGAKRMKGKSPACRQPVKLKKLRWD